MRRVILRDMDEVRGAATDLADWAVGYGLGRVSGDPVHEWVTEGRRLQYERAYAAGHSWARSMRAGYSSCADLAHWLLMMLGARDESVINRGDDGGARGWSVGANISRLVSSRWYVRTGTPQVGDIIHVGGADHVSVLLDVISPAVWRTADYGQPHARRRIVDVDAGYVRGRCMRGYIDLSLVERPAPACVPDGCMHGTIADDPGDIRIPEGVR